MPNTPNINIVTGALDGTLAKGQTFYWYNPNANDVAITIQNCGTWCASSQYTIPANQQYAEAQILDTPNENPIAWSESPNEWTADGGGPHIASETGVYNPPIVNIQTGMVSGSLENGKAFNWNNPLPGAVEITNCGAWCAASSYTANTGLTAAAMATVPNDKACAWTESPNRWNAPGMPHVGTPPWPSPKNEEQEKEVA
ncbi:MAG: hypothetical protein WA477_06015 [Candidatus Sulfotelmatobacter sp.]